MNPISSPQLVNERRKHPHKYAGTQQPQKNIPTQAQTVKNTSVKISEIKEEDLTE